MPDMPTVAESGIPGYDVTTWHGWLAPRGTPAAIIRKLNQELVKAATARDISERLAEDGGLAIGSSPGDFGRHMADEVARWHEAGQGKRAQDRLTGDGPWFSS